MIVNANRTSDIWLLNNFDEQSTDKLRISDRKKSINALAFRHSLRVVDTLDRMKQNRTILASLETFENDHISSMSSLDSQNELWDNFKKSPRQGGIDERAVTAEPAQRNKRIMSENHNRMLNEGGGRSSSISGGLRNQGLLEKYERNLEKIKEAHKIEIQNLTTTFHNKAKDMIYNKVEEMRAKFESEIKTLMTELARVKLVLREKDNQVARLTIMLDEKQIMTENFERKAELKSSNGQQHGIIRNDQGSNENEEKSAKQNDIVIMEQLKSENETLQRLCNLYKSDESKALAEVESIKKNMEQMRYDYEEKIRKIQDESNRKIDELQTKIQNIMTQFTDYRKATDLELKVLKTIVDRAKNIGHQGLEPIVRGKSAHNKTLPTGSRGALSSLIEHNQKNKTLNIAITDSKSSLSTKLNMNLSRKNRMINEDENDNTSLNFTTDMSKNLL